TGQQWQACDDPRRLLGHLRGRAGPRGLRLAAVACCHLVWPLTTDPRSREAVEVAERFADGEVAPGQLAAAREAARAGASTRAAASRWAPSSATRGVSSWSLLRPRFSSATPPGHTAPWPGLAVTAPPRL